MKFRVERQELTEALADVSRVATARTSAMPALAGVELAVSGEALTLSCTDKEISIQSTLSVGGQKDGVAVPSARVLTDLVRGLPDGKVQIALEAESLVVEAARAAPRAAADDHVVRQPQPCAGRCADQRCAGAVRAVHWPTARPIRSAGGLDPAQ